MLLLAQSPNPDDQVINYYVFQAFSKKLIAERKEWLTDFMEDETARDRILYEEDTMNVSYRDFMNIEFILYSNLANERSIPSLCDGVHGPALRCNNIIIFLYLYV